MSESDFPWMKNELASVTLLPEHPDQPRRKSWRSRLIVNGFLAVFTSLILYHYLYAGIAGILRFHSVPCPNMRAAESSDLKKPSPMDVFEVYPPVRVGQDYLPELGDSEVRASECKVLLMEHVFGWSYGKPFVGSYKPPPCEWTNVLFNLTMTSAGRQFDRLAMMFLGDIEVFRTSTAEPTWYGIEFSYVKDMTAYTSLLKKDQKIIFDLGNLVDDSYTGSFNATLTATFYTPPPVTITEEAPSPADSIIPISQRNSIKNQPSHYHLPQDRAKEVIAIPPNAVRATVSISASGNAAEEFWYTNVPTDFTETFGVENSLPGNSPFREIQLLADGEILGVAWPFATIFTGGINPGLWRPIVGIAAFDIPEYEIDITPFLPLLVGRPAAFEIKVVSWDPNPELAQKIEADWLVSGRVFVWRDHDPDRITTGVIHKRSSKQPKFELTTTLEKAGGRNTSLGLQLTAHRSLSVTSTIITSTGPRVVSWTQGLSYSNTNVLTANGTKQTVRQITQGTLASAGTQSLTFRWPLTVTSSFEVDPKHGNFTIRADIDRTVEETTSSASGSGRDPVFAKGPGTLYTRQNGSAVFASGRYARGTTEQHMTFIGVPGNGEGVGSYRRWAKAEGGELVGDEEIINGKPVEKASALNGGGEDAGEDIAEWMAAGARRSVRAILGRGPG